MGLIQTTHAICVLLCTLTQRVVRKEQEIFYRVFVYILRKTCGVYTMKNHALLKEANEKKSTQRTSFREYTEMLGELY